MKKLFIIFFTLTASALSCPWTPADCEALKDRLKNDSMNISIGDLQRTIALLKSTNALDDLEEKIAQEKSFLRRNGLHVERGRLAEQLGKDRRAVNPALHSLLAEKFDTIDDNEMLRETSKQCVECLEYLMALAVIEQYENKHNAAIAA